MKETITYNMTNVEMVETTICGGTVKTILIYADTPRFGQHEIMAQFPDRKSALKWLTDNGVDLHALAIEWLEKEINSHREKVQIGNAMYRRLEKDKTGDVYGYSRRNGYTNITKYYFNDAIVTGANIAKCTFRYWTGDTGTATIKFGSACTW